MIGMKQVTRLLVLSPDSKLSPSYLAREVSTLSSSLFVKQTCYGVLVEGDEDEVDNVVTEIKKLDPLRIFSKVRAFPVGDKRRCRAVRGAARPGFYFLEQEIETLPLIVKALECMGGEEHAPPEVPSCLDPDTLKRIIEEST
ncbi:methanogenesis marker 6 protein [archaeon]|nr:MAG: methanogenesis marker 6 protein [archaeon]